MNRIDGMASHGDETGSPAVPSETTAEEGTLELDFSLMSLCGSKTLVRWGVFGRCAGCGRSTYDSLTR